MYETNEKDNSGGGKESIYAKVKNCFIAFSFLISYVFIIQENVKVGSKTESIIELPLEPQGVRLVEEKASKKFD